MRYNGSVGPCVGENNSQNRRMIMIGIEQLVTLGVQVAAAWLLSNGCTASQSLVGGAIGLLGG